MKDQRLSGAFPTKSLPGKSAIELADARGLGHPTPAAAAAGFGAAAHRLSVYDGQRLCGYIVDMDVGRGLGPAHAFDDEGHPLGIFRNRRTAVAAIAARERFEAERTAA